MEVRTRWVSAALVIATSWASGAHPEASIEARDGLELHLGPDGRVVDLRAAGSGLPDASVLTT